MACNKVAFIQLRDRSADRRRRVALLPAITSALAAGTAHARAAAFPAGAARGEIITRSNGRH